jgi:hypothetical protein
MITTHLEILVEEPSMEAFLRQALPRILGQHATFSIYVYQGKAALLRKLPDRLRGWARWLPASHRILVLLDRDDDDCDQLKTTMELAATGAGLRTRTNSGGEPWQVVNRIVIEELEAWFFGEWSAVRKAYPRVSMRVAGQAAYRLPDSIAGGTWEALERVLRSAGYYDQGIQKKEVADAVGRHMDPDANISPSFAIFRAAVLEAFPPVTASSDPT